MDISKERIIYIIYIYLSVSSVSLKSSTSSLRVHFASIAAWRILVFNSKGNIGGTSAPAYPAHSYTIE